MDDDAPARSGLQANISSADEECKRRTNPAAAELAVFLLGDIALELSCLSFDKLWWLLAMKSTWPNLPLVLGTTGID